MSSTSHGNASADLEVCKALHARSGWGNTWLSWYCDEEHDDDPALNLSESTKVVGGVGYFDRLYPAYDVAYLLAMLPAHTLSKLGNETYVACWCDYSRLAYRVEATSRTNPANALCRLAIRLFQEGVLLRPESGAADQTHMKA